MLCMIFSKIKFIMIIWFVTPYLWSDLFRECEVFSRTNPDWHFYIKVEKTNYE
jgi:hypothetical protein